MQSSNAFPDTTSCPVIHQKSSHEKIEIVCLVYLSSSKRPQQHKEDWEPP